MTAVLLDAPGVDRTTCDQPRHGSQKAYRDGCRCPDTRAANSHYRSDLRLRNIAAGRITVKTTPVLRRMAPPRAPGDVDGKPTVERLRIMAGLGFGWPFIAAWLGPEHAIDVEAVAKLARTRLGRGRFRVFVSARLARRVRDLYSEVVFWPAPFGPAADAALDEAVAAGWGVVDLVAIRRALVDANRKDKRFRQGVPLTRLEERAVLYTGGVLGLSHTAISRVTNTIVGRVGAALAA